MVRVTNNISSGHARTIQIFIILAFGVLAGRFAYLQLFNHQQYQSRAEANRIRETATQAPRGLIFDRQGQLLVDNRLSYQVSVTPWEVDQNPRTLRLLSQYLKIPLNNLSKRIRESNRNAFLPVRIANGVSFPLYSRLAEHRLDLPGTSLANEPIRFYPSDANLSHILGYLREIDGSQLHNTQNNEHYRAGDMIGWEGLEKQYQPVLHGKTGYKYLQINAMGQILGPLENQEPKSPIPGHNLRVSLDVNLQSYAESLFDSLSGAAVVMNARTGEIYAMVSAPTFELSTFAGMVEYSHWNSLVADTTRLF